MGRKKITEFSAKRILYSAFGIPYKGISYNIKKDTLEHVLDALAPDKKYVVKVDQGVKGRFKKGLVALDKKVSEIPGVVSVIANKGYDQFLIEPYFVHDADVEKYLSLDRTRDGIKILYSVKGGVDIESNAQHVKEMLVSSSKEVEDIAQELTIPTKFLEKILSLFDVAYFSFLEINPFIIMDNSLYILDIACEVDSAGEFFVDNKWSKNDYVAQMSSKESLEEKEIAELASQSQASFKFEIINKDGSIFVLLSGGGASVVVADEVYNQGYHKELGNYGEYSGNPNTEETYLYTRSLLHSLLKSKNKKKVLIIGGGVANFTDIRLTFKGVIQALGEKAEDLRKGKVKIFVRRGGPNEKEGLLLMEEFLKKEKLYGDVKGPEMVLTDIVLSAIKHLKNE